jgi:hypothetical protein
MTAYPPRADASEHHCRIGHRFKLTPFGLGACVDCGCTIAHHHKDGAVLYSTDVDSLWTEKRPGCPAAVRAQGAA